MFQVYSDHITNRHRYIFKFIFENMLGLDFILSQDLDAFTAFEGFKLNYSNTPIDGVPSITPHSLLVENHIGNPQIDVFEHQGVKAFFRTSDGSFPFDMFAASFYLLSRYEEYLPQGADQSAWEAAFLDVHERFRADKSVAYQASFLNQPVVDQWVLQFKKYLHSFYADAIVFKPSAFTYTSTIDVDNGYAFKGKGLLKTIGGIGISLINRDFKTVSSRLKVVTNMGKDPFDEYDYQQRIKEDFGLDMIYFMLAGIGSKFDHNIPVSSKSYKALVSKIKTFASLGLHPSYASHFYEDGVFNEKMTLQSVSGLSIAKSRQHFIKMEFPGTYERLISSGITLDYSMGYASMPGFRAGTSNAFPFYNLLMEEERPLTLFPFQVMDVTFKDYLKIPAVEAMNQISAIIKVIKEVNGNFTSVWHDRTFARTEKNMQWILLYEQMVRFVRNL
jgi:hypothetical protein